METGRDGAAAALVKMLDHRRKWGCAANAVLIAFIVTVPAMAILFSARTSAPAVWIGAANALRLGTAPYHGRCTRAYVRTVFLLVPCLRYYHFRCSVVREDMCNQDIVSMPLCL